MLEQGRERAGIVVRRYQRMLVDVQLRGLRAVLAAFDERSIRNRLIFLNDATTAQLAGLRPQ